MQHKIVNVNTCAGGSASNKGQSLKYSKLIYYPTYNTLQQVVAIWNVLNEKKHRTRQL